MRLIPRPESLRVDLWEHSAEQAGYLMRAMIDECTAGAIPLALVQISPDIWAAESPCAHYVICLSDGLGSPHKAL